MSSEKRKSPAFQLYADDFIAGTSEMSAEEVGWYIRLLCHQWSKGGIPNDEGRAMRIAGAIAVPLGSLSFGYVFAKFSLSDDGNLRNKRLEAVRAERSSYIQKQAENGSKGGKKRWKHGDPNGGASSGAIATPLANGCPDDSSPSPSPYSNTQERAVELPEGFPDSETAAAVAAGFVGCTETFAIAQWRLAVGRGGRDAKDVPIRSWRHYLSAMRGYSLSREAEQKHRNEAKKPSPPPNETPEQREKRLLKQSL